MLHIYVETWQEFKWSLLKSRLMKTLSLSLSEKIKVRELKHGFLVYLRASIVTQSLMLDK